MQIDQVRNKIDEVVKETNIIKQSWIEKQNKNVQLLAQLNYQFNELAKVRKCKYIYIIIIYKKIIKYCY